MNKPPLGRRAQDVIDNLLSNPEILESLGYLPKGSISDGYHTFDELYEFRKVYNRL